MTTKKADCIRNVSSWSHVLPEHKFDNIKYNKKEILDNISSILSPKITLIIIDEIHKIFSSDLKKIDKNDFSVKTMINKCLSIK